MGLLGAIISPDYPHGNNGQDGRSSGERNGGSRPAGSGGAPPASGGSYGGGSTAG